VIFSLTPTEAFVSDGNVAAVTFRGTKTVSSTNVSSYDFGPVGRQYTFEAFFDADTDFNFLLSDGGSLTRTSGFSGDLGGSIVNNSLTAPVPEPGTVALLVGAGIGGLMLRRRKK
jgi:hypothetical protein